MQRVVLVLDVIRGFFEEGFPLYCGDKARRIIPKIQKLLEKELAQGSKVFFLCDQHDPDDLEFDMFPPHCIKGSPEIEVIPELCKYEGEIIPKTRFSCFLRTELQDKLDKINGFGQEEKTQESRHRPLLLLDGWAPNLPFL